MRQHLRGILIKVNNNYSEYVTNTTAYLWIKYWSVFCFISWCQRPPMYIMQCRHGKCTHWQIWFGLSFAIEWSNWTAGTEWGEIMEVFVRNSVKTHGRKYAFLGRIQLFCNKKQILTCTSHELQLFDTSVMIKGRADDWSVPFLSVLYLCYCFITDHSIAHSQSAESTTAKYGVEQCVQTVRWKIILIIRFLFSQQGIKL